MLPSWPGSQLPFELGGTMHTGVGKSWPRVKILPFEHLLTPGPVALWQSASVVHGLPDVPSAAMVVPPSSPASPVVPPELLPAPASWWTTPLLLPASPPVAPPLLLEQPLPASAATLTSATDVARPNNFFHAMTCLLTLQRKSTTPFARRCSTE